MLRNSGTGDNYVNAKPTAEACIGDNDVNPRETSDTGFGDGNVNQIQYYDINDNDRVSPTDTNHDERVERLNIPVAEEKAKADLRIPELLKYTSQCTANLLHQQEQSCLANASARLNSQLQSHRSEAEQEIHTQKQSHRAEAEQ